MHFGPLEPLRFKRHLEETLVKISSKWRGDVSVTIAPESPPHVSRRTETHFSAPCRRALGSRSEEPVPEPDIAADRSDPREVSRPRLRVAREGGPPELGSDVETVPDADGRPDGGSGGAGDAVGHLVAAGGRVAGHVGEPAAPTDVRGDDATVTDRPPRPQAALDGHRVAHVAGVGPPDLGEELEREVRARRPVDAEAAPERRVEEGEGALTREAHVQHAQCGMEAEHHLRTSLDSSEPLLHVARDRLATLAGRGRDGGRRSRLLARDAGAIVAELAPAAGMSAAPAVVRVVLQVAARLAADRELAADRPVVGLGGGLRRDHAHDVQVALRVALLETVDVVRHARLVDRDRAPVRTVVADARVGVARVRMRARLADVVGDDARGVRRTGRARRRRLAATAGGLVGAVVTGGARYQHVGALLPRGGAGRRARARDHRVGVVHRPVARPAVGADLTHGDAVPRAKVLAGVVLRVGPRGEGQERAEEGEGRHQSLHGARPLAVAWWPLWVLEN